MLLTASADQDVKLWNVETGRELFTFRQPGPAKSVAWSESEKLFAVAVDNFNASPVAIRVYEFADVRERQSADPIMVLTDPSAPKLLVTNVAWLPLDAGIVATYQDGSMATWDATTGELLAQWDAHESNITALSFNRHKTLAITSSTDMTACLWRVPEAANVPWECIKTYETDTPLNSASISPAREHVLVGGGQEARDVTTTAASAGRFEARFHHMVFGHELGRIQDHFGPINTLSFSPDGRSYASGGEDGYVRLHHFGRDYEALGAEEERDLADPALSAALADGTLERLEREEVEAEAKAAAAAAATAAALGSGAPAPAAASSGVTGIARLIPGFTGLMR
jgi:translation initiation factor 3 subunit I